MNHIEHQQQVALIQWATATRLPHASDVKPGSRVVDYLLAIPNGGARLKREAIRLKAEGVKPGVSDLLLPLRRKGLAGLWLELKAPGKRPTGMQYEWLERMELAGYLATWADDWTHAAGVIARYVGVPEPVPTIPRAETTGRACLAAGASNDRR